MRSGVIPKGCRTLIGVIEKEGGRILDARQRKNHMTVDYTFDGHEIFTQTLPRHNSLSPREARNFRAAIRRTKPQRN